MAIKIQLQGLDKVLKRFNNAEADLVKRVDKILLRFALGTVSDAKNFAPTDEGFLKNSIRFDTKPLEVEVVVKADYAPYIEFGTRKFAAVYVSSLPSDWQVFASEFRGKGGGSFEELVMRITLWVKRKGIDEKAAYPIALKILREGILPHPFLFPAYEKNRKQLLDDFKKDI